MTHRHKRRHGLPPARYSRDIKQTGCAAHSDDDGAGQLSHITSWLFKVTGLKPAEAFCFMGLSQSSGDVLCDAASVRCTNVSHAIIDSVWVAFFQEC